MTVSYLVENFKNLLLMSLIQLIFMYPPNRHFFLWPLFYVFLFPLFHYLVRQEAVGQSQRNGTSSLPPIASSPPPSPPPPQLSANSSKQKVIRPQAVWCDTTKKKKKHPACVFPPCFVYHFNTQLPLWNRNTCTHIPGCIIIVFPAASPPRQHLFWSCSSLLTSVPGAVFLCRSCLQRRGKGCRKENTWLTSWKTKSLKNNPSQCKTSQKNVLQ